MRNSSQEIHYSRLKLLSPRPRYSPFSFTISATSQATISTDPASKANVFHLFKTALPSRPAAQIPASATRSPQNVTQHLIRPFWVLQATFSLLQVLRFCLTEASLSRLPLKLVLYFFACFHPSFALFPVSSLFFFFSFRFPCSSLLLFSVKSFSSWQLCLLLLEAAMAAAFLPQLSVPGLAIMKLFFLQQIPLEFAPQFQAVSMPSSHSLGFSFLL